MAVRTRYVNTASTPGGDGTTNNTSGANRAYASLDECLTAEAGDLGGDSLLILCEGTAADVTATTVTGFSNYAKITIQGNNTAAGRHPGYYSTSHYRIEDKNDYGAIIDIQQPNVEVIGIQTYALSTSDTVYEGGIELNNGGAGAGTTLIRENIVRMNNTGSGDALAGDGEAGDNIFIINNVVYDANNCLSFDYTNATQWTVYNNTVINSNGSAIWIESVGTLYLKNNLVKSSTTNYRVQNNTTEVTAANCSSDATSPDGSSYQNRVYTFVDEANDNFHLAASDTGAKDLGVDLSSDSRYAFNTDIDGETRTAPWDVGADEVVSGLGGTLGVAGETDSSQQLARNKSKAVGVSTQTDTALAVTASKGRTLGVAGETDSSQQLVRSKNKAVGVSTQTDAALAVTASKGRTLGVAAETESAQSFSSVKNKLIQAPLETNTAQTLNAGKSRSVATTTESDVAQSVGRAKRKDAASVAETDNAQNLARSKSNILGVATQTDNSQTIARTKSRTVASVVETDSALPIGTGAGTSLGVAQETDIALPIGARKAKVLNVAIESNIVIGVGVGKRKSVGVVAEVDLAVAFASYKSRVLGQVVEIDGAVSVATGKNLVIGLVSESDLALSIVVPGFDNVATFTAEILQSRGFVVAVERSYATDSFVMTAKNWPGYV